MSGYETALARLSSFGRFGIRPGLERIKLLLELMGNPERDFQTIHVAGTNGKGSTAMMISGALVAAGFKTGSYFSPHIDDFRERIRINGEMISKSDTACLFDEVYSIAHRQKKIFSFFEIVTAMALKHFSNEGADYAVLEVGMGGRWDATNACDSKVSVITNIDLEHTEWLGNSIRKIAFEKSGIIKEGARVITAETKNDALAEMNKKCGKMDAELVRVGKEIKVKTLACTDRRNKYRIATRANEYDVALSLLGARQGMNAACAVGAVEALGLNIPKRAIERGISRAWLPCRLEVVGRNPLVIMDGAHNPSAMKYLRESLKLFDFEKMILVIGMMKDKDIRGVVQEMAPAADVVIANKPKVERAAEPEIIANEAKKYNKNVYIVRDVKKSIQFARNLASVHDLILITGSIYMLAEARGKNRMRITL
ncbi:MAG: folylpolyglutamate synthase/dihydrofolate synthase family protein [Candidatus Micrarchaeota archaeon]